MPNEMVYLVLSKGQFAGANWRSYEFKALAVAEKYLDFMKANEPTARHILVPVSVSDEAEVLTKQHIDLEA